MESLTIAARRDAPVLERLERGVRRFQRNTYPQHAELYQKLAWLRNAWAAKGIAEALSMPDETRQDGLVRMTEESVRLQLHHLKTHPAAAAAIARGRLTLSGWIYDIGSGRVRICRDGDRRFEPLAGDDR